MKLPMTHPEPQISIPLSAKIFLASLDRIEQGHFTLITPEGAHLSFGDPSHAMLATLQIHDWRACAGILRSGDIGFADAYRLGSVDTPDLVALVRFALLNQSGVSHSIDGGKLSQLWHALRHRLRANTRNGSRRNIHAHYDLGNTFYGLCVDLHGILTQVLHRILTHP